jgi:hypothetical protein
VDWSKWHVFWVDERVVPKDHEDSNYKLALDGFLSKVFFAISWTKDILILLLLIGNFLIVRVIGTWNIGITQD